MGARPRRSSRASCGSCRRRVVDAFSPYLINTHPAYLPEFPGAHGVRDALAAGVDRDRREPHRRRQLRRRRPDHRAGARAGAARRHRVDPPRPHQARRAPPAHPGRARHRQLAPRPEGAPHDHERPQPRPEPLPRPRRRPRAPRARLGERQDADSSSSPPRSSRAGVEIVSTGSTAKAIARRRASR